MVNQAVTTLAACGMVNECHVVAPTQILVNISPLRPKRSREKVRLALRHALGAGCRNPGSAGHGRILGRLDCLKVPDRRDKTGTRGLLALQDTIRQSVMLNFRQDNPASPHQYKTFSQSVHALRRIDPRHLEFYPIVNERAAELLAGAQHTLHH